MLYSVVVATLFGPINHGNPCDSASLNEPCPALAAEGEGGMRAGAIVGTCEEMCPVPERERRSRLSDIQVGLSTFSRLHYAMHAPVPVQ